MDWTWLTNPEAWLALVTLTALEIVLGIDNIVFISILAGKLPKEQQQSARRNGLLAALGMRIALLLSISWVMQLVDPVFSIFEKEFSWRDLILIVGGFFLLWKATREIHHKLEGDEGVSSTKVRATFSAVIFQIVLIDAVFSLDSVITAVGMVRAEWIGVMITAIVLAVLFMLFLARPVGEFVERHPTVKMLALSFLLLIGLTLIVEGFGGHIAKGYIYSAMGFSVFVEMLNLKLAKKRGKVVDLNEPYLADEKANGASGSAV